MTDDTLSIARALAVVQRALAISQLPEQQRQWLAVFHLKLTRMRDRNTVLRPENRGRLERLTAMVEDMLELHRQALN